MRDESPASLDRLIASGKNDKAEITYRILEFITCQSFICMLLRNKIIAYFYHDILISFVTNRQSLLTVRCNGSDGNSRGSGNCPPRPSASYSHVVVEVVVVVVVVVGEEVVVAVAEVVTVTVMVFVVVVVC